MTEITEDLLRSLDRAKLGILMKTNSTFFTEIAFSFKYKFSYEVPTAATDGLSVFVNPDFWNPLNDQERIGLLVHEASHPAYLHLVRGEGKDFKVWNIAADHCINLKLLEQGFELPKGGYHDSRFTDMSTDQIYEILMSEKDPNEPDEPMSGIGQDLLQPPDGVDAEALQAHIENTVIRATIRAKQENQAGSIPGDVQIFIERLLNPRLPWQKVLNRYIREKIKEDYSMNRPNRRYLAHGMYLASQQSEGLIRLSVATDTSGSVSDAMFRQFIGETAGILRMLKPPKMDFIQFDHKLQSVDPLTDFRDLMKVKFTGRGGTCIKEVMQWAQENKPQLLLMFTDGYFNFPRIEPPKGTEVIWIIYGNNTFTPPYGKVVNYTFED